MTSLSRKIHKFGDIRYRNENGKTHREDGPAKIWPNGSKEWWENDKFIKKS